MTLPAAAATWGVLLYTCMRRRRRVSGWGAACDLACAACCLEMCFTASIAGNCCVIWQRWQLWMMVCLPPPPHTHTDTQTEPGIGGELMCSTLVAGSPGDAMTALTHPASDSSLLGPGARAVTLEEGDGWTVGENYLEAGDLIWYDLIWYDLIFAYSMV